MLASNQIISTLKPCTVSWLLVKILNKIKRVCLSLSDDVLFCDPKSVFLRQRESCVFSWPALSNFSNGPRCWHCMQQSLQEMEIDTERLKVEFQAIGDEYNFNQTELNRALDVESNALGIDWGNKLLLLFNFVVCPSSKPKERCGN